MNFLYVLLISLVIGMTGAFAGEEVRVVLGKVDTNKSMATPCSQKRKNVKAELAEIEQEIKDGSKGTGSSI